MHFIKIMLCFVPNIKQLIMTIKKKRTIYYVCFVVMIITPGLLTNFNKDASYTFTIALAAVAAFLIGFNSLVRKSPLFKGYFISRFNIFSEKMTWEKEFDFDQELLFNKIMEVIDDSNFELVSSDSAQGKIFAIAKMKPNSWGENLYFDFTSKDNHTVLKLTSTSVFGWRLFGDTENNWNKFMNDFEESLTI